MIGAHDFFPAGQESIEKNFKEWNPRVTPGVPCPRGHLAAPPGFASSVIMLSANNDRKMHVATCCEESGSARSHNKRKANFSRLYHLPLDGVDMMSDTVVPWYPHLWARTFGM